MLPFHQVFLLVVTKTFNQVSHLLLCCRWMQVRIPGVGRVRSGHRQEEQDGRTETGAHGRDLRRHRHGHQALRENPQDQAAG